MVKYPLIYGTYYVYHDFDTAIYTMTITAYEGNTVLGYYYKEGKKCFGYVSKIHIFDNIMGAKLCLLYYKIIKFFKGELRV